MDEFVLCIDKDKFRSTNAKWNELMLNDPWSVGYVSTLIEAAVWKSKEEWEDTYYRSGEARNKYIFENSSKLGYSISFFNDTTVPFNKSKYYSLPWEVKNINTQRGRTRQDLSEKGQILYEAVKNNGYGLSVDECIECVRFRVICETWNGIILREHNTRANLSRLFPNLIFKETDGEKDHTYAVDLEAFSQDGQLLCGIQVKPKSYLQNAPYIVKARNANQHKYAAYKERFGRDVITIISNSKGDVLSQDVLNKIKDIASNN